MELNQICKHITKSDSLINSRLVHQRVANASHLVEVSAVHCLSGFAVAFQVLDASQQHALLHILIHCS
jgi:hypothetical protein